ncbi:hypothetical protein MCUN1_002901 [Malassezia cuniculi]|uniref:Uncharacterized protein n=1 Tax=Malassezia cuniculi TaxID=948313 RepID=A0AAF0J7E7_9BASI|nr:hypothetical protein MCUN1_002901 [Malassezia cuniculi]
MSDAELKRPPDEASTPPSKKARASLVTLRGARLALKQRPVGWEHTMPVLKAVLSFQSALGEATEPFSAFPHAHLTLVASLTQESDKTAADLAKSIKAMVAPDGQGADVLPLSVIQDAISLVAERHNYGIDDVDIPTLQIWRWEVKDDALLPEENREKLRARREERVKAREEAREQWAALPSESKQALTQGKKPPKQSKPPPQAPETPTREQLREARRAERQAREDKVEKDKQAQAKMFNSFFQRTTTKTAEEVPKTDFEATFLPCEYKNMAPINRFYTGAPQQALTQTERTADDLLGEFQRTFGGKRRKVPQTKGIHPPVCVRDVMQVVRESDILGGNAAEQAKRGLEKLNNRKLVQIKLLQFQTDRRPGWFGTWTRSTNLISARRPFGQDPMALDYNYDSDAEWEEGDEGENVDGMDDKDDDDSSVAGSESDSEMDDWLEDDLEEAGDGDEGVIPERDAHHIDAGDKKKKKVKWLGRRFDSKLVPYISGPHFETRLGVPAHESFEPYRIVFLNDAPPGLDPLSFVARVADDGQSVTKKPVSTEGPVAESPAPSRPTKSSFPDTHLSELLTRIEGSTRPKPVLIEDLRTHFAPHIKNLSKASIEAKINECAARESKKPDAPDTISDLPDMIEELKSVLVPDEEIRQIREYSERMRSAEAAHEREQAELNSIVSELEESVRTLRESTTRSAADWRSLNEHTAAMQAMENEKFDLAKKINEQEAALSTLESEIEQLRQESDAIDDWSVERDVAMDKDA